MCRCYSDGAVLLHISHEVVVSDQVISTSTTTTSIAPWISGVAVAVVVAVVVVHHAGELRRGEAVAVAQLLHLHMDNGSTCSLSDPLHYSSNAPRRAPPRFRPPRPAPLRRGPPG